MKRKSTATDMKPQEEQSSIANRSKQEQEQTEEMPDTSGSAGESEQHGNFRRWWSDYQKKMKSAFQLTPLKLQMQGEQ